jgi:hypothetical protein
MRIDQAQARTDSRQRWRMLHQLSATRRFGRTAAWIRDILETSGTMEKFRDDGHLLDLCYDLADAGYVATSDLRADRDQELAPTHLELTITANGIRQVQGLNPPDPLLDDLRPTAQRPAKGGR